MRVVASCIALLLAGCIFGPDYERPKSDIPASFRFAMNNVRGAAVISAESSPVTVRVIPPAEDLIIVNHVVRLLAN